MDANQADTVLMRIPLQGELYRLELVVLDDKGDRTYTINERGKVIDSGRNQGIHWLIAEYAHRSGQDLPDAVIAYEHEGDRLVRLYALEQWEIIALGYNDACDHLCVAVEVDDAGFLTCQYGAYETAQEFADWIKS